MDEDFILHFNRIKIIKGLKKIGRADLLIASIALTHKAILVTRNVRHFKMYLHYVLKIGWIKR